MTTQLNKKNKRQEIEKELNSFTGTTQYYRHSPQLFPNFYLTDGTYFLAESCEAHWLIDYIASQQLNPKIREHPKLKQIQFWTLKVENSRGVIFCEWDSGFEVFREKIDYTDFPLDLIRIWVSPLYFGPDDVEPPLKLVAFLPSEY